MAQGPKLPDFGNFARMFSDLKFPAMPDMSAMVTATQRNMDVFTAANRIALDAAQAIARRHTEMMQQSMTEMSEAMRAFTGSGTPQEKAARQAELLKEAYEHAATNMKELHDLMQKSHQEAMALLSSRFTEAMEEVKSLAEKAT